MSDLMNEFFNSWRRKAGVLLLLLACLFMAGWIRGLKTVDFIEYPIGDQAWHAWAISEGSIRCWTITTEIAPCERVPRSFRWRAYDVLTAMFVNGDEPIWRWRENRLQPYAGPIWSWQIPCNLFIPYWSIVIPITALSAWLIFQPRLSKIEGTQHARE
jgi:hypothetical protein